MNEVTGRTANMALVMLLLTGIMIYSIKPIKDLENSWEILDIYFFSLPFFLLFGKMYPR